VIYVYGMVMEAMKHMHVVMMLMSLICGRVQTSRRQLYAVVPMKRLENVQSMATKLFKFIMEKSFCGCFGVVIDDVQN
jgi:hypothetical protein